MGRNIVFVLFFIFCINFAYAGGVDGGGGNVQLPNQVKEERLIRATEMSKPIILSWLSKASDDYQRRIRVKACQEADQADDCAIFSKLFDPKPNIFEVISRMQIETKMNQACLDFNNKENDGSMYGQKPGSICLSISNLKSKLREDNYENQIAALILHEATHLLGTTEAEAQRLQWYMLRMDLADIPASRVWTNIYVARDHIFDLSNLLQHWSQRMNRLSSYDGACSETNQVLEKFYNLHSQYIDDFHFILLTPEYHGLFWGLNIKMRATWNFLCGQDGKESLLEREMASSIYNFQFKDKTQLTAVEYGGGFSEYASPSVLINKITNQAILNSETSEISSEFKKIAVWYSNSFMRNEFQVYQTQI